MRPRFYVLSAGTDQDIDTIFAGLIQQRIGVLLVSADPFFLQLTPEQQSFRRHLVGENLKRIATVRPPTHEPSKEEMAEIRAAVEAAGLTPRFVLRRLDSSDPTPFAVGPRLTEIDEAHFD